MIGYNESIKKLGLTQTNAKILTCPHYVSLRVIIFLLKDKFYVTSHSD